MLKIKVILQAEETFKLTPAGRVIDNDLVITRMRQLLQQNDWSMRFIECFNCGLIMDEKSFTQGCPQCGCKNEFDFYDTPVQPTNQVLQTV